MALANGTVFWVSDPTDSVVAIITCFVTLLIIGQLRQPPKWILPVLDAIGLAVFVGIGVNKAFASGAVPLIAVCMGVITGVGGGMLRDVLARGNSAYPAHRDLRHRLHRRRYCAYRGVQ